MLQAQAQKQKTGTAQAVKTAQPAETSPRRKLHDDFRSTESSELKRLEEEKKKTQLPEEQNDLEFAAIDGDPYMRDAARKKRVKYLKSLSSRAFGEDFKALDDGIGELDEDVDC